MPPVDIRIQNSRRASNGQMLQFPKDIGKHGMLFVFKEYKYQQTRGLLKTGSYSGESILLPLPRQLMDRTGVRLSNRVELGLLGEAAALGASNGTGISGMAAEAAKALPGGDQAWSALYGLLTGNANQNAGDAVAQSSYLIRKTLGGVASNIASGIDIGSGTTINPKAALGFEGVEMKMHSFDWDLAPNSFTESESLKSIIKVIKKNMLPAYQDLSIGGTDTIQRAFLKYPAMVDIFLIGVDSTHFFEYKTAMIGDFSVNYSQTGSVAMLAGGKPAIANIQMTVFEADIHTSADYGGESGGVAQESLVSASDKER